MVPNTIMWAWLTSPRSVCPALGQNGQANARAGATKSASVARRSSRMVDGRLREVGGRAGVGIIHISCHSGQAICAGLEKILWAAPPAHAGGSLAQASLPRERGEP